MRPRSIRARITGIATVVVALVLLVAGVVVVVIVQEQLRDDLDRALEQRADQVAATANGDPGAGLANSNAEDRFAQVIGADGSVILATPNVVGAPALAARPTVEQSVSTREDLPLEDDAYRVLVRRSGGVARDGGYVIVGENVDDVRDGVRTLMATLALVFPLAATAIAIAVWWLVGRTLRLVEAIRSEVAAVGIDGLDRRVEVPPTGDEVARLAVTMNDMLARLEDASARQRTFVADASHELRTPLTRLRTALEVDLRDAQADLAATCRNALEDTKEMQHLVDDLLFLARRDAGSLTLVSDLVDLDVVIEHEVRERRRGADAPPRLEMSGVSGATVRGDAGQLARVVRNLLDNALRHAASAVSVSLAEEPDKVVLAVSDDGPGIPVDERDRIFERFARVDDARADREGGAGLGLAIVRDVVTAHGGSITVSESATGGARFTVTLPKP